MSGRTRAGRHRRCDAYSGASPALWCTLAIVMTLGPTGLAAQDSTGPETSEALRGAVDGAFLPPNSGELAVTRLALGRLYELAGARPIWIVEGRPTAQARGLVAGLVAVDDWGLDPAAYGADSLARWMAAFATRAGGTFSDDARFDVALSVAAMRVFAHLHAGRVDPRALGLHLPPTHTRTDLAALTLAVARAPDVDSAIADLQPPYAGYRALIRLLAQYRALAADSSLSAPQMRREAVRPGDLYDDAPVLRRLLAALGDFAMHGESMARPSEVPSTMRSSPLTPSIDSLRYDEDLAEAVRAFQERHGLEQDAILGPATLAALRVPLIDRAEQIALTLERWRWLSDSPPPRYVIVNVGAFRLDAFVLPLASDRSALSMKVIVGEARGHRTPLFFGTMSEVVFRPFWDVPPSITRKELLPAIRRDPTYLHRNDLEIVRGGDDDAVIYPPTAANLGRVADGMLRLRQRPGPDNALGPIKFVFANPYNVYLHGTPAHALFARTRRDFSHGCIRIEDPHGLAELVLRTEPGWNRASIEAATGDTATRRVRVREPVGVIVFYATAVADENDRALFLPDVYGHDARLKAALGR